MSKEIKFKVYFKNERKEGNESKMIKIIVNSLGHLSMAAGNGFCSVSKK